jgi:Domain of unknown function (DUF6798)
MMPTLKLHSDEVLFVVLFGLLATAVGYQVGLGNQTEHLPIVLRLLDPNYLQSDFFVNSAVEFGPRFYYVHLLAFFAQWVPLPLVVLTLALTINIALGALTILAARDLLAADRLAGFIAAILVVSVSSVPLGLVTDIRFLDLQPASLAIPGCLAALWAGLRGKPVIAALLAGVSCIPHPLYGVETGAIAIGTALCVGLVEPDFPPSKTRVSTVVLAVLSATLLLAGFAFVFWALPQIGRPGDPLTTQELIDILANFRAPHHYIASRFPIEHYAALAFFLAAVAMCWHQWRDGRPRHLSTLKFFVPPVIVLFACGIGYILMEVWPSRVGVVAQPFRMLYLVKWIGFLFLGWQISKWIGQRNLRSSFGWIGLLGSGAAHAVIAFFSVASDRLDHHLRRSGSRIPLLLVPIAFLATTVLLLVKAGKIDETLLVVVAMGIAIPLASASQHRGRRIFPVALVALVLLVAGANRTTQFLHWNFLNPIVSFADHRGDHADAARWARQNTESDALFLIPPDMGTFRILARRAVVVDFEAIPFEGAAMREWRNRMRDSYGDVMSGGFVAREEMIKNYRQLSAAKLDSLASSYNVDFAVLYAETTIDQPVLYRNATFKIVALSAP